MSKRRSKRNGMTLKVLTLVLAVILLVGASVGGTVAWLSAKTEAVENTFTVGDVVIRLEETPITVKDNGTIEEGTPAEGVNNKYPLVPGVKYTKDPVVTVEADSEKCYLFVKFEEKGNSATYIQYTSNLTVQNGWTELENDVWYRIVEDTDADQQWYLLAGGDDNHGEITINHETVKKDTMEQAKLASLTYSAYAVQYEKANGDAFTPAEAWAEVSK